jgi:hypothetical protein
LTVNVIDAKTIELAGSCPLEDAELLFQHLLENPAATIEWTGCEQALTAVIQVILASNCRLKGPPSGTFLRVHVEPAFQRARKANSAFPS